MAMLKSCLLLFIIFSMGNTEVNSTSNVRVGTVDLADSCPAGWIKFELRCYKYISHPTNWLTAESYCQSLGATLASVSNKLENDFLLSLLPSPSTRSWIGANDNVQEGRWLWSDGSLFLYTKWCAGEPNSAGVPENCLEINFSSNRCWNDVPCSISFSSICVKNLRDLYAVPQRVT